MPGFFLTNVFTTNSLQSDFIAPIFYGILAICYYANFKSLKEKDGV